MSLNNCNKKIVKQNDCVAKYRRRNEVEDKTECKPYVSKNTFKKRRKQIVADKSNSVTVSSNNLKFKIVRQTKNSKPNRTIYKIGNQEFYFYIKFFLVILSSSFTSINNLSAISKVNEFGPSLNAWSGSL